MASRAPDHLSQNCNWRNSINLHKRITIRPRHSIPIISAILSIIRPIRRIPGLIVHRAIQPLWNSILGKHIRIEENLSAISLRTIQTTSSTYACHVTTIRSWILAVVRRLHIARIGACLGVIALALAEGEVLVAHIATGGRWGVNCTAQFSWTIVARASWGRGVFVVGLGAKLASASWGYKY